MEKFLNLILTGFYVGKLPFAPGTWGTFWAIPLFLLLAPFGGVVYLTVTFILIFIFIACCQLYENISQTHDSSEIIVDEIVGCLIAFYLLPITWQTILIGFLLFRLFDIWKPYPISFIDKKVKGGFGVVLDDVVAGLFANIILQIIYYNTSLLGVMLNG